MFTTKGKTILDRMHFVVGKQKALEVKYSVSCNNWRNDVLQ